MRVIHCTSSIGQAAGGVGEVVKSLSDSQKLNTRIDPIVFSVTKKPHQSNSERSGIVYQYFEQKFNTGYSYSPFLKKGIETSNADLLHMHGIWSYPSLANYLAQKNIKIPYILSPHGMLDEWALKRSKVKKAFVSVLYEKQHILNASCIHALCAEEALAIKNYGYKGYISVIPNGINIPHNVESTHSPWSDEVLKGRKVLLYLGRIHPKKGLKELLEAFSAVINENPTVSEEWVIIIVGWEQGNHRAELNILIKEKKMEESVIFWHPLFGDAKLAAYKYSDAFVLPSMSEGLPMVVLEAWSQKLPVLMTDECNLQEGFNFGASVRIDHGEYMENGLKKFFCMSIKEQELMGLRGLKLVTNNYQWGNIAKKFEELYFWVTEGGEAPDTVSQI